MIVLFVALFFIIASNTKSNMDSVSTFNFNFEKQY